MSGPEWALQVAVRAALAADAGVKAWLGDPARVYDEPPEDPVFPYLTCGRSESRPLDGDGAGVIEQILHLRLWSRYAGRKETKEAVAAVRAALQDLSITADGHHHSGIRVTYTDVFRVGDGRTTQAIEVSPPQERVSAPGRRTR
jgi:hypothetical protein